MYGGIKAWALATAAALGLAAFAAPVHAGETASGHVDQVSTLLGTPYSSAIEGFASRDSVLAGEEISFAVASDRPWRMDVFRVGAYGSGDALLSYSSGEFQPANVDVAAVLDPVTLMVSAPWTVTNSVSTTGFRSGLYVARIADDVGAQNLIPFIVRDGDLRGRTVVVAGFATYQAYNAWGGKNAYRDIVTGWRNRSRVVSMDRPLDARGLAALQAYEFTTAIAVDSAIGDAAWATGQDVSEGRVDLTGVATIVSPGHDEYWSGGQRDAIDAAVAGGSNLFVTGANAGYWQVRFESPDSAGVARRMAIYKNHRQDPVFATNPSAATVRFEGRHIRRPITLLTGLTYNCFPSSGEFTVTDNSWWGFAGTGVQPGQSFAGLSGRESDGYRGGQGPGVARPGRRRLDRRLQGPELPPLDGLCDSSLRSRSDRHRLHGVAVRDGHPLRHGGTRGRGLRPYGDSHDPSRGGTWAPGRAVPDPLRSRVRGRRAVGETTMLPHATVLVR